MINKTENNGKTIRDAVHGDIKIPEPFVQIIDTPEFQRLRRIRQLSTAYLLFPTAEHTRFSHSIGTFYVMTLLIDHFKPLLERVNVNISEREKNLALCVALLHDIGHGPFSHAFENALPNTVNQKKHEQWTIDIITSPKSKINNVIVNTFGKQFPIIVAALIKKERKIKDVGLPKKTSEKINLLFVISSLISSQLDADRMDYLLRDAYFTGVSYGRFDLSRLISALTLTVHNDQYFVCVQEKYLPAIEEYLLARYHMFDGVYLHRFKCQMELIVKKILFRAYELYITQSLAEDSVPKAILKIFKSKTVSITDYLTLDDAVMLSIFTNWKNSKDPILSELCSAILDRSKFLQLNVLDSQKASIEDFEINISKVLNKYKFKKVDLDNAYFWIKEKVSNTGYDKKKENIWILKNNGIVVDLSDISLIVTDKLLKSKERYLTFINFDIMRLAARNKDAQSAIDEIKEIINFYNIRMHVEIEKKYFVKSSRVFKKVLARLNKLDGYELSDGTNEELVDVYYDTNKDDLLKSRITLRIRRKGKVYKLTIKTPPKQRINENQDNTSSKHYQNERFEYEAVISGGDIKYAADYLNKHNYIEPNLLHISELVQRLVVKTIRRKMKLVQNSISLEVAFDEVTYVKDRTSLTEKWIEIELKSEYIHRINLKIISDHLENEVPDLIPTRDSKYERGLSLIKSEGPL